MSTLPPWVHDHQLQPLLLLEATLLLFELLPVPLLYSPQTCKVEIPMRGTDQIIALNSLQNAASF